MSKKAYYDARNRCNNSNHKRYADWGGRGIRFEFESYDAFMQEMGGKPLGYSLDRIDNNGNYCVGNVRWASHSTQQLNKRVRKTNKFGMTGVREVKAKGLVTPTYQAYINVNGKFKQLYAGPSLEDAISARRQYVLE